MKPVNIMGRLIVSGEGGTAGAGSEIYDEVAMD